MRISDAGVDLIKSFEGCKLEAYQDSVGVWTIGWGHTGPVNGEKITAGLTITEQEAEELIYNDIAQFEDGVNKLTQELDITQGMFDALVCFSYNVGLGNLAKSTLLKLLKQNKVLEASEQFKVWNKAGGKELAGLTRRRNAEAELFLS